MTGQARAVVVTEETIHVIEEVMLEMARRLDPRWNALRDVVLAWKVARPVAGDGSPSSRTPQPSKPWEPRFTERPGGHLFVCRDVDESGGLAEREQGRIGSKAQGPRPARLPAEHPHLGTWTPGRASSRSASPPLTEPGSPAALTIGRGTRSTVEEPTPRLREQAEPPLGRGSPSLPAPEPPAAFIGVPALDMWSRRV